MGILTVNALPVTSFFGGILAIVLAASALAVGLTRVGKSPFILLPAQIFHIFHYPAAEVGQFAHATMYFHLLISSLSSRLTIGLSLILRHAAGSNTFYGAKEKSTLQYRSRANGKIYNILH
jgi:hypothetical protein